MKWCQRSHRLLLKCHKTGIALIICEILTRLSDLVFERQLFFPSLVWFKFRNKERNIISSTLYSIQELHLFSYDVGHRGISCHISTIYPLVLLHERKSNCSTSLNAPHMARPRDMTPHYFEFDYVTNIRAIIRNTNRFHQIWLYYIISIKELLSECFLIDLKIKQFT